MMVINDKKSTAFSNCHRRCDALQVQFVSGWQLSSSIINFQWHLSWCEFLWLPTLGWLMDQQLCRRLPIVARCLEIVCRHHHHPHDHRHHCCHQFMTTANIMIMFMPHEQICIAQQKVSHHPDLIILITRSWDSISNFRRATWGPRSTLQRSYSLLYAPGTGLSLWFICSHNWYWYWNYKVHTDISTCVYTFGTSGLSVAIRCWWHCFCYCKTRCMIDLCIRCNRSPTTGLCKTNGWSRQVWEVNLQGDLLQTHNLRFEISNT